MADRFSKWQKPTLIVWGPADPLATPEYGAKFCISPAAGRINQEEGGHYPQEHWHEVVEDLLPFLRPKCLS